MAADIMGMAEVQKLFEEVGEAPAKVLTTATRKGANIALRYARDHVPVGVEWTTGQYAHEPGTLKRSLKLKKEKRKKGQSVFDVGPDKNGWYAHFLDTGFTTRNGKFIPGCRFLRDSVDRNRDVIQSTILSVMGEELDKLR